MKPSDLQDRIEPMTATVNQLAANMEGGRAYAATPDGRQKVEELRRDLRAWASILRTGLRQIDRAERLLGKVLGKRWGILA